MACIATVLQYKGFIWVSGKGLYYYMPYIATTVVCTLGFLVHISVISYVYTEAGLDMRNAQVKVLSQPGPNSEWCHEMAKWKLAGKD